jgi:PilZ domain
MRRLGPQQIVSVNLPMTFGRHEDLLDFRVVAVIDSVVALEPLVRSDTRLIPDRVRDCYMTFGQGAGLVGLKGHLYERSPGDWRFKVTDPMSFPADNASRIRVCAPVTLAAQASHPDAASVVAETVNIGADGVLVDGGGGWAPPERAMVTLSLPGHDEAIEAPARLVARQGMLCDFKYEAMDARTRNRLGHFIIEYQRDALRRRQAWYQAEVVGLDDDLDF